MGEGDHRGISLTAPGSDRRMDWMDALRGVAIILVMVWHAPFIPTVFGWQMGDSIHDLNTFLQPFRMPTLMFLSGLLLPRALRKDWRSYYRGKIRLLAWPYLVWVLIHFVQYGPDHPLTSWRAWYATGYLWFLFFIGVYYLVAPVVTRFVPAFLTPWAFLVAWTLAPAGLERRILYFAIFYFCGYWLATSPSILAQVRGWRVGVLGCIALLWGAVAVEGELLIAFRAQYAVFSLAGVLALCWLANRVPVRWLGPLAFVGRHSLIYYVAHYPIMTLVVQLAEHSFMRYEPSIWIINLAVGLLGCTLLALWRDHPAIFWLFEMPSLLVHWYHRAATLLGCRLTGSGPGGVEPPGAAEPDGSSAGPSEVGGADDEPLDGLPGVRPGIMNW